MVGGRVYCGPGECCQFPEIIIVEISWAAKFCVGGVVGRVKLFFIAEGRNFGRVYGVRKGLGAKNFVKNGRERKENNSCGVSLSLFVLCIVG